MAGFHAIGWYVLRAAKGLCSDVKSLVYIFKIGFIFSFTMKLVFLYRIMTRGILIEA